MAHLDLTVQTLATEVQSIGPGWIVRTRELPLVWTLNEVHLTHPTTLADALSLTDQHQADLSYRHLVVDDETTGAQLERDLGAAGWRADREVLMVLVAPPDREVDTGGVIVLQENEMLGLMRRWIIEDHPGITSEGIDQLVEFTRREGRLRKERRFGVRDKGGSPAAVTKLRSDGKTAWVEDVYTVPEARRRGYARALVTHVTNLARSRAHEVIYIVADDNDWPKHLYANVGFRPIGRRRTFHREVAP